MSQTLAQLIQGLSVNSSTPSGSLTIDSSGRLLVGTSTARGVGSSSNQNNRIQIADVGGTIGGLSTYYYSADGGSNTWNFCKSRGLSEGSFTIVNSGDSLGSINWIGADGTGFTSTAASINAAVDGTPGANDMPGRLVFSTTADGASSPTERFRISSDGSFSSVIPGGSTLYPRFGCRAWVNFNGTTASPSTIRGSGNVSSVTKNGTGDYTVNFTSALADANYSIVGMSRNNHVGATDPNTGYGASICISNPTAPTTTAVRIWAVGLVSTGAAANVVTAQDQATINVAIFR